METIWFCLVAVMIAMYVLLDGFDLGAGAIHFLVARTNEDAARSSLPLVLYGTATKSGCWPPAALFILLFPRCTPVASAAFTCR